MAAIRRAKAPWLVVAMVGAGACDFDLDVVLVPTATSVAVLVVDLPDSGEVSVRGIPVDDDRGEISVPFDRGGAGRLAVVQLEASLEALGLRVGPNEVSAEGQPLPGGAILEAPYADGSIGAFAASDGLPPIRVVVDQPCPRLTEARRSITTQASVRFLDVGTELLLQLDDGRTFDFEGELDVPPSASGARLDDGQLALLDADGIVLLGNSALPETPGPRARRRASIVGSTDDLAVATDTGAFIRWDGDWTEAPLPGPLGRRFALASDGEGRIVLGGTALVGIVDWPRAAAPTRVSDVLATALSFDGPSMVIGTADGTLLLETESTISVLGRPSVYPIVALDAREGRGVLVDEAGRVIGFRRHVFCDIATVDGPMLATGAGAGAAVVVEQTTDGIDLRVWK